jgi:hypothetical protein
MWLLSSAGNKVAAGLVERKPGVDLVEEDVSVP